VRLDAQPLVAERWHLELDAEFGPLERRTQGFANRWKFVHERDFSVIVESTREWDGGDDWIHDEGERFARRLGEILEVGPFDP
jgi:hypothetical protein